MTQQTRERLLIVDDRPARGEYARNEAAALGYDVMLTRHAREFMRAFESFNPTAIILEVVLPDIDGIELIHWLRDRCSGIRVLLPSTARTDFDYAEMALKIGMAGGLDVTIVPKPLRGGALQAALA